MASGDSTPLRDTLRLMPAVRLMFLLKLIAWLLIGLLAWQESRSFHCQNKQTSKVFETSEVQH
jgi:hypothetical protein